MGQNYALVVDDHPLVASGIANFLITHCQFKQACVVTNEDDCYRQIRDHGPPRLLVIDFGSLPNGPEITQRSKATLPTGTTHGGQRG